MGEMRRDVGEGDEDGVKKVHLRGLHRCSAKSNKQKNDNTPPLTHSNYTYSHPPACLISETFLDTDCNAAATLHRHSSWKILQHLL
ncbi:hypothetical protein Pcinc_004718 [Petrolisthes cinctipes]|uniref:Uncharacterized protein n=1 Tax=Petrolisthes cinctipes TaxID=88211 RepID=A0AAE1GE93_PETCI|nr:hypothetical protein Pcinc_004718 [Petrolisthes cinctipes]